MARDDQNRIDWGNEGIEFNLRVSGWFALFRKLGGEVLDDQGPRPESPGPERLRQATLAWGYRYPAEQVWKRRRPPAER